MKIVAKKTFIGSWLDIGCSFDIGSFKLIDSVKCRWASKMDVIPSLYNNLIFFMLVLFLLLFFHTFHSMKSSHCVFLHLLYVSFQSLSFLLHHSVIIAPFNVSLSLSLSLSSCCYYLLLIIFVFCLQIVLNLFRLSVFR